MTIPTTGHRRGQLDPSPTHCSCFGMVYYSVTRLGKFCSVWVTFGVLGNYNKYNFLVDWTFKLSYKTGTLVDFGKLSLLCGKEIGNLHVKLPIKYFGLILTTWALSNSTQPVTLIVYWVLSSDMTNENKNFKFFSLRWKYFLSFPRIIPKIAFSDSGDYEQLHFNWKTLEVAILAILFLFGFVRCFPSLKYLRILRSEWCTHELVQDR